jgi:hypothetical protein
MLVMAGVNQTRHIQATGLINIMTVQEKVMKTAKVMEEASATPNLQVTDQKKTIQGTTESPMKIGSEPKIIETKILIPLPRSTFQSSTEELDKLI